MPTRLHAVAVPAASEGQPFDATVGAREQQRVVLRRRITRSRTALLVGAGVLVTGAAILTGTLIAGAPKDRHDDGNDGFEFLYGAIPVGVGVLTVLVSGPIFIHSKNRLGALAEPRRATPRVRPSLSASGRGAQAGLVLDLQF